MTTLKHPSAAEWLRSEYCNRRKDNARYSVRSFARRLGLAPGAVSEMMGGRRPITAKSAEKIADKLELRPEARGRFLALAKGAPVRAPKKRATADAPVSGFHLVDADHFSVIADWYHFAILGLFKLDDCPASAAWMAKKLGLSRVEVDAALDRLERLGLIARKGKDWRRTHARLTTTVDVPSAALRLSHKQTLQQAIASLDDVPVELRDITSISVALDRAQLPKAKNLIRDFRQSMLELLESGAKNELYNLNVQLVPVTVQESAK